MAELLIGTVEVFASDQKPYIRVRPKSVGIPDADAISAATARQLQLVINTELGQ